MKIIKINDHIYEIYYDNNILNLHFNKFGINTIGMCCNNSTHFWARTLSILSGDFYINYEFEWIKPSLEIKNTIIKLTKMYYSILG